MKNKYLILAGFILLSGISCKKTFLENVATTNATEDTYYTTPEQVNGATGLLYNSVWGSWFDKAFSSVGDVLGGTVTGAAGNDQYNSFYNFNIQSTDGLISQTWNSCYQAAGDASVLLNIFKRKQEKNGGAFYTQGIAEARFIRGFAYFYIGRTFGDVPIVPDPVALTEPGQANVPRYFQKDVLRFAIEDLKYAELNLPDVASQPGRVTKYSAKGMMAKVYLYLKDYVNAKAKAQEVINYATSTSNIGLFNDYNKMFTSSSSNNNKESLFSLQWLTSLGWNGGNRFQLYVGPQPLLAPAPTSGAGYSALVPSIDMLNPATGWLPNDKRKDWSVMEHGFQKSEWVNANFPTGFRYDTTAATDNSHIKTGTRSSIQKYVVGPNRTGEPVNSNSHSQIGTYILRYADVLLIYAEATMGGSGSTTDATALSAYNQVHTRAGLLPVTAINIDELLRERKCEFAFEGDYWFDVQRQGFAKAKIMVAAQERGTYDFNKQLTSFRANLSSPAQLFLPIPQSETVINPKLLEPAVSFY